GALPGLTLGPPRQQSEVDQLGQPCGGGCLGDSDPLGEVVESGGAVIGLTHDQHRGLGTERRHGLLDRALADRGPCLAVSQHALQEWHRSPPFWVATSIPSCYT